MILNTELILFSILFQERSLAENSEDSVPVSVGPDSCLSLEAFPTSCVLPLPQRDNTVCLLYLTGLR